MSLEGIETEKGKFNGLGKEGVVMFLKGIETFLIFVILVENSDDVVMFLKGIETNFSMKIKHSLPSKLLCS